MIGLNILRSNTVECFISLVYATKLRQQFIDNVSNAIALLDKTSTDKVVKVDCLFLTIHVKIPRHAAQWRFYLYVIDMRITSTSISI